MDLDEARGVAAIKLAELQAEAGKPLEFYDGRLGVDSVAEHQWCWVFHYNSLDYLETGSILDQLLAGPIVVPKDGSEPFTLGTYAPEDQQLDDYLARRGPYSGR